MKEIERIHLIGIGGSGLSAIAQVLLERGMRVSGSDRQPSPALLKLEQAGARIAIGHRSENIDSADLVVRSSAIPDTNVEVVAAQAAGIPVLKRAEFLAWLTKDQTVIAIAGTHGKTTTTSLVAWLLVKAGLDPSYIIGGVSLNLQGNAHAGQGKYFVIEADEYDRMFLGLNPAVAVVTNIEYDHPDCYPTSQDFYQAFRDFASRIQPDGLLVSCSDDVGARRLMAEVAATGRQTLSYGITSDNCMCRGLNLRLNSSGGFEFEAHRESGLTPLLISLQIPGEHNVRNALAAILVATHLNIPDVTIGKALREFRGAGRRFEIRGEIHGITLIDDYGHHPTEIRATLSGARGHYPGKILWAVWQPHTYSRTRALFSEFAAAFSDVQHVLVTEIYAARESAPADGFSARQLVEAINQASATSTGAAQKAHFTAGIPEAHDYLITHLQPEAVVVVFSAGDADQLNTWLLEDLSSVFNPPIPGANHER